MYTELGQKPSSSSTAVKLYSYIATKKKIISAWRYPGVSPVGKRIPIPDEILMEIERGLE